MKPRKTLRLRALLQQKTFLHMPAVYDALGARLVQHAGFYVSGASRAVSEPLLTMTEQIAIAADAASGVEIAQLVLTHTHDSNMRSRAIEASYLFYADYADSDAGILPTAEEPFVEVWHK